MLPVHVVKRSGSSRVNQGVICLDKQPRNTCIPTHNHCSGHVSGKMSYEDVKNRLLGAVPEYRENRMDDGVMKFLAAKMGRNEQRDQVNR